MVQGAWWSTSQEEVAPAFGIEGAQGEAQEDDGGPQEGGHDDAAETHGQAFQSSLPPHKCVHPLHCVSAETVVSALLDISMFET